MESSGSGTALPASTVTADTQGGRSLAYLVSLHEVLRGGGEAEPVQVHRPGLGVPLAQQVADLTHHTPHDRQTYGSGYQISTTDERQRRTTTTTSTWLLGERPLSLAHYMHTPPNPTPSSPLASPNREHVPDDFVPCRRGGGGEGQRRGLVEREREVRARAVLHRGQVVQIQVVLTHAQAGKAREERCQQREGAAWRGDMDGLVEGYLRAFPPFPPLRPTTNVHPAWEVRPTDLERDLVVRSLRHRDVVHHHEQLAAQLRLVPAAALPQTQPRLRPHLRDTEHRTSRRLDSWHKI